LVDPTREEEDVSEVRLTVGSTKDTISSMQKGNSKTLSIEDLNNILDRIGNIRKTILSAIEKSSK
jgi:exosome complex RNA-binding protein Rrp42 (RNase PH superfamily)